MKLEKITKKRTMRMKKRVKRPKKKKVTKRKKRMSKRTCLNKDSAAAEQGQV